MLPAAIKGLNPKHKYPNLYECIIPQKLCILRAVKVVNLRKENHLCVLNHGQTGINFLT